MNCAGQKSPLRNNNMSATCFAARADRFLKCCRRASVAISFGAKFRDQKNAIWEYRRFDTGEDARHYRLPWVPFVKAKAKCLRTKEAGSNEGGNSGRDC